MIAKPNPTLYVSNIDWKIKKPLLRRALHSLFTRHGKLLEIITLRSERLRGQAWVIMETVQGATASLQAENGTSFFGRDIKIAYANETSDRIAKRDGTYVPKAKRIKAEQPKKEEVARTPPAEELPKSTAPPSHILLAQDLPEDVTKAMLEMLFQQYTGYKEVRIPRPGLGFVEFETEPHATLAMKGLHGFQLTAKNVLKLDYGKA
mmetsp:Transcript_12632/g.19560  ORF Transcript_12632/g.19560 Transcript_12632/m.19560 type:complete len:206 (-) Transcript_12632:131-748(-)